jgi:hypothetical protein
MKPGIIRGLGVAVHVGVGPTGVCEVAVAVVAAGLGVGVAGVGVLDARVAAGVCSDVGAGKSGAAAVAAAEGEVVGVAAGSDASGSGAPGVRARPISPHAIAAKTIATSPAWRIARAIADHDDREADGSEVRVVASWTKQASTAISCRGPGSAIRLRRFRRWRRRSPSP